MLYHYLQEIFHFIILLGFLSGARSTLPMGVALGAMIGCFQQVIGSIFFLHVQEFLDWTRSFSLITDDVIADEDDILSSSLTKMLIWRVHSVTR
jgi:hypothetical protein